MNEPTQSPGASQEPFDLDEGQSASGPLGLTDNEKLMACLSYASQLILPAVLPIILLLTEESKRSAFVRYHAMHTLALLAASIIYELVVVGVYVLASAIAACLACVLWVLFPVPFAVFCYYAVIAFQGKSPEVPYLTKFLRDSKWLYAVSGATTPDLPA